MIQRKKAALPLVGEEQPFIQKTGPAGTYPDRSTPGYKPICLNNRLKKNFRKLRHLPQFL